MGFKLFLLLMLSLSCVKDEGKISAAKNTGTPAPDETGEVANTADPLAEHAWHLNNTGQNSFSSSGGISGQDISAKYVQETLGILGRNVRVAVSDSGVDITHPDLDSNTLAGEHRNYTFNSSLSWHNASPMPSDDVSHGTGVSGLIAAEGWNGIGSRGVAPLAKFAGFRFIFSDSSSTQASRLAKTIDQLYGEFDVFNYSYGKAGYVFVDEDSTVFDALKLGVTTLRNGKGTLYVQSSGNSFFEEYLVCDPEVDGPACIIESSGNSNAHSGLSTPYKIVVGAVNARGEKSSYSTPGSNLWVSAPGGEYGFNSPAMITTDIRGCNAGYSYRNENYAQYFDYGYFAQNLQCDYTNTFNGTSSAAPVTSGVIALILEANPNLSWRDVKHILAMTSDKVDFDPLMNQLDHPLGLDIFGYQYDNKWLMNSAGNLFSNWYGFGRVNARVAVNMAIGYNLSTMGTFAQTQNSDEIWFYDSGAMIGNTIADESALAPAESTIWVGHNLTIESIQIQLTTNHPYPGDLAVHLISPGGTESRLLNLNSNIYGNGLEANFLMASNAFYGEPSSGNWTIKVYDGNSLYGTGDLLNWKILVSGHKPSLEINDPNPPVFITLGSTPVSSSVTPFFAFSESDSSVTTYEAAVGLTPNDIAIKGWTNIGLATSGQQLSGMTLNDDQTYYLKIRARNGLRVSYPQVISWEANY